MRALLLNSLSGKIGVKPDYCDSDKLALSGSNHNTFLRLDTIVSFPGFARRNVEYIALLVVLDIKLAWFQYYALHTTSPFSFFGSDVKYAVIIRFWPESSR